MPAQEVLLTEDYTFTFGTEGHLVRSQTFIDGTEGFIDALKLIGNRTDALAEVDYYIEAIAEGSVKVHIKALYKQANHIATSHLPGIILIGILVNWIYDKIKTDDTPQIVINNESVIFDFHGQKIVIPKDAASYYEKIKDADDIDRSVKKTFKATGDDVSVGYVGISYDNPNNLVSFNIPRSFIETLAKDDPVEEKTEKIRAEITIIRAILERSKRKWEFDWNGTKISSPITDEAFYRKFEGHVYQIAPGDRLVVELAIKKRLDKKSGVWESISHEITSVWDVKQDKKPQQTQIDH